MKWGGTAHAVKRGRPFGKARMRKNRQDACTGVREQRRLSMLRPHISTNLAISADGKISSVAGIPSGWTSRADHQRLLALRKNADALMVGRGTLESDQMTLTVPGKAVQPLRCIVSKSGNVDPAHPIFQKEGGEIHLLATEGTGKAGFNMSQRVAWHAGNLAEFLETLAEHHSVKHLHCEGGGQLIRALAELDVIDEFHVTISGHTLFGGLKAPTASGVPQEFLEATRNYKISHFEAHPELGECFLSYIRERPLV